MKELFYTYSFCIGSAISYFMGGLDKLFIVLCVFLAIDYVSGIIVALVFKKSVKTETGKLNSAVSFKGLCKKMFILILVGIANLLDVVLDTSFVRDGVILAFISNETISIIENAGLMGINIPPIIREAIEILSDRSEEKHE